MQGGEFIDGVTGDGSYGGIRGDPGTVWKVGAYGIEDPLHFCVPYGQGVGAGEEDLFGVGVPVFQFHFNVVKGGLDVLDVLVHRAESAPVPGAPGRDRKENGMHLVLGVIDRIVSIHG